MVKKSCEYEKKMNELRTEILNDIFALLEERNVESINMYEYWATADLDRCLFFDCDDDGYGVALYIDTLYFDKNAEFKLTLKMNDENDSYYETWNESNLFEVTQMNYLLSMLENIVENADEYLLKGRILKAYETFDDIDTEK